LIARSVNFSKTAVTVRDPRACATGRENAEGEFGFQSRVSASPRWRGRETFVEREDVFASAKRARPLLTGKNF
jgi:hypothetical protein